MAERIFDIQSFIWWEADSSSKWPDNSFYSAENVEIRRDLQWVRLSSALETYWTYDASIIYMTTQTELWVWTNPIICLSNWKVYFGATNVFTLAEATTEYNKIIWIGYQNVSWTEYLYYFTDTSSWTWKVHRTDIDWNSISTNVLTYTVKQQSEDVRAYCINYTWNLYVATSNKVFIMDNTWVLEEALELESNWFISWFTQFQDRFNIYMNKRYATWKQYVWSWVDWTEPYYAQEWYWLPVLWITNDWSSDYWILWPWWTYTDVYQIPWTQKWELRVTNEWDTNSRELNSYISNRQWILYISWWKSWESSNYWIYTYWNYFPWTPKSLVQQFSWTTSQFKYQAHTTDRTYFACADNKVYYIIHDFIPINYASSWYIITKLYEENAWEEKKITKIKVWFKLQTQSSIKIYIRKEVWDSWLLVKTIDYTTYQNKRTCTISPAEINSVNLWNFTTLQIKSELIAWTSTDYTPILKRITTFMETVNEL